MEDLRIQRDRLTDPDDAEQVWWDVIERVYDELQTPYEPDSRLQRVSPGQRALYALHWMRSEVDNGGFHQYLLNPTGMLANEALRGAHLIEAREFADLLRDLLALFPAGRLLQEHDDRAAFLERLTESEQATLTDLDERFYELMGENDPSRLALHCASYVEKHPDEFFLPLPALRP